MLFGLPDCLLAGRGHIQPSFIREGSELKLASGD